MSATAWIFCALVGGPIVALCIWITIQNLRALGRGEDLRVREGWTPQADEREAPR